MREIITRAIGEASMCWSETPKGVFDSSRACEILERALAEIEGRHIESEKCWCQPELKNDFTSEGGAKHFVHRDRQ